MKVCAVIVTYGDRFHLLSQVIDGLRKEMIDEIVVIDNGSATSYKIEVYKREFFPNLIIHRFEENSGTAKAFKTGIELAIKTECDFIWLMDDDTLAEPNSLKYLKKAWNDRYKKKDEMSIALCSYRNDRPNFVKSVANNDPHAILPSKNNFAGFHLKTIFSKFGERFLTRKKINAGKANEIISINAAPYGGLFFHKDILGKIGLPDESYFLYVDDFDFSIRIKQKDGEILLITKSNLHDLESSFYLPARKKLLYHSALDSAKDSSAYYAIRNTIHFSKKYLTTSKVIYLMNKMFFLVFIHLLGLLRGKSQRLKVIRDAIKDGETGKLGFNSNYKI